MGDLIEGYSDAVGFRAVVGSAAGVAVCICLLLAFFGFGIDDVHVFLAFLSTLFHFLCTVKY